MGDWRESKRPRQKTGQWTRKKLRAHRLEQQQLAGQHRKPRLRNDPVLGKIPYQP